ncbi:MAG: hypothetical protein AB1714_04155 [Acidobacteriota bacterium]
MREYVICVFIASLACVVSQTSQAQQVTIISVADEREILRGVMDAVFLSPTELAISGRFPVARVLGPGNSVRSIALESAARSSAHGLKLLDLTTGSAPDCIKGIEDYGTFDLFPAFGADGNRYLVACFDDHNVVYKARRKDGTLISRTETAAFKVTDFWVDSEGKGHFLGGQEGIEYRRIENWLEPELSPGLPPPRGRHRIGDRIVDLDPAGGVRRAATLQFHGQGSRSLGFMSDGSFLCAERHYPGPNGDVVIYGPEGSVRKNGLIDEILSKLRENCGECKSMSADGFWPLAARGNRVAFMGFAEAGEGEFVKYVLADIR